MHNTLLIPHPCRRLPHTHIHGPQLIEAERPAGGIRVARRGVVDEDDEAGDGPADAGDVEPGGGPARAGGEEVQRDEAGGDEVGEGGWGHGAGGIGLRGEVDLDVGVGDVVGCSWVGISGKGEQGGWLVRWGGMEFASGVGVGGVEGRKEGGEGI